jgi:probable phosphoglycerate mutase
LTTFFLIRHALTDAIGRYLPGTAPGTPINEAGRSEVAALVERLRNVPLSAVIAGPLERAQQTALPIAESHGLRLQVDPLFSEFSVGDWTLRPFSELAADSGWQRFNTARSVSRPPNGELMLEVQQRAVVRLLQLAEEHPSASLAIVSHGDVIRAALMYFLGMPIDLFLRVDVLPATVNVVTFDGHTPVVRQVNGGIDPPVV